MSTSISFIKNKATPNKITYRSQTNVSDPKIAETSQQIDIINQHCEQLNKIKVQGGLKSGDMVKELLLQIINTIEGELVGNGRIEREDVDIMKGLLKCVNIPGLNADAFIDNIVHYALHSKGGLFNYFNHINYTTSIKAILERLKLDKTSRRDNQFSRLKPEEDYKTENNILVFIDAIKDQMKAFDIPLMSLYAKNTWLTYKLLIPTTLDDTLSLNLMALLNSDRYLIWPAIITQAFLILSVLGHLKKMCEATQRDFYHEFKDILGKLTKEKQIVVCVMCKERTTDQTLITASEKYIQEAKLLSTGSVS